MTQEEKREALIEYAKEHFRDLIPYSDPRYEERLQEWAESYADSELNPNQEMEDYLNSLCEEHDKLIEDIEL